MEEGELVSDSESQKEGMLSDCKPGKLDDSASSEAVQSEVKPGVVSVENTAGEAQIDDEEEQRAAKELLQGLESDEDDQPAPFSPVVDAQMMEVRVPMPKKKFYVHDITHRYCKFEKSADITHLIFDTYSFIPKNIFLKRECVLDPAIEHAMWSSDSYLFVVDDYERRRQMAVELANTTKMPNIKVFLVVRNDSIRMLRSGDLVSCNRFGPWPPPSGNLADGEKRVHVITIAELYCDLLMYSNNKAYAYLNCAIFIFEDLIEVSKREVGIIYEIATILLPKSTYQAIFLTPLISNFDLVGQWLARTLDRKMHCVVYKPAKQARHLLGVEDAVHCVELVSPSGKFKDSAFHELMKYLDFEEIQKRRIRLNDKRRYITRYEFDPEIVKVVRMLNDTKLAPIVVYCHQVEDCNDVLRALRAVTFTNQNEQNQMRQFFNTFFAQMRVDSKSDHFQDYIAFAVRGIFACHADVLPCFRRITENFVKRGWATVIVADRVFLEETDIHPPSIVINGARFFDASANEFRWIRPDEYRELVRRVHVDASKDTTPTVLTLMGNKPPIKMPEDVAREIFTTTSLPLESAYLDLKGLPLSHACVVYQPIPESRSLALYQAHSPPTALEKAISNLNTHPLNESPHDVFSKYDTAVEKLSTLCKKVDGVVFTPSNIFKFLAPGRFVEIARYGVAVVISVDFRAEAADLYDGTLITLCIRVDAENYDIDGITVSPRPGLPTSGCFVQRKIRDILKVGIHRLSIPAKFEHQKEVDWVARMTDIFLERSKGEMEWITAEHIANSTKIPGVKTVIDKIKRLEREVQKLVSSFPSLKNDFLLAKKRTELAERIPEVREEFEIQTRIKRSPVFEAAYRLGTINVLGDWTPLGYLTCQLQPYVCDGVCLATLIYRGGLQDAGSSVMLALLGSFVRLDFDNPDYKPPYNLLPFINRIKQQITETQEYLRQKTAVYEPPALAKVAPIFANRAAEKGSIEEIIAGTSVESGIAADFLKRLIDLCDVICRLLESGECLNIDYDVLKTGLQALYTYRII